MLGELTSGHDPRPTDAETIRFGSERYEELDIALPKSERVLSLRACRSIEYLAFIAIPIPDGSCLSPLSRASFDLYGRGRKAVREILAKNDGRRGHRVRRHHTVDGIESCSRLSVGEVSKVKSCKTG